MNEDDLTFPIKKTRAALSKVMTHEDIWQEALNNRLEEMDIDMMKAHHESQVDWANLDTKKTFS